ncbi:hypothetical protein A1Q2_00549 [Trichosporon asahii var. asahii CBS 8904]|uniref:Uncharacterized protein n=2 Tax=Trichosporon asahii var. asahii TaxID=189963 RepID=K1W8K7_TRIAC|nr:hypothetical protein A1Q1_03990 [Trichosporon asahii var. asahii CBS 2479]EJT52474.1 hypothetical protein A1Q1_03990 [Trichosporon asahii var. asahii CBS 2479]EKD05128.1 hypothetical protein A1Q2_00549 [Trichosporon asahii var. asahii CBS 8904]
MSQTHDLGAPEKGVLLPLYTDSKNALEQSDTPHPLYTDEWLNGEPWRYRAILAINLLLIICGQYAFLW